MQSGFAALPNIFSRPRTGSAILALLTVVTIITIFAIVTIPGDFQ